MWVKVSLILGFPTLACAAMGYAGWAVVVWCGENVAKPVVAEHITTLRTMTATQTAIAAAVANQSETLKKIEAILSTTQMMHNPPPVPQEPGIDL